MSGNTYFSPVQFHGQTLFVLSHHGQPFTPMKPIVEGMGMAWQSQHAKLKANASRWSITNIVTVAEDGKNREVVCMPLRKLPGWLMTINPKKVAPSIRETVILYQNECDDALWDFWTKGEAVNKRTVASKPLPSAGHPGTIQSYAWFYPSLPTTPDLWRKLSMRAYHAFENFGKELDAIRDEAFAPFRENRRSGVATFVDEAMGPHRAMFRIADEQIHTAYRCIYETMNGLVAMHALLKRG